MNSLLTESKSLSARVSDGEMEGVKKITRWAEKNGKLQKVEVLGFVDGGKSVDWIVESGAKVINLLCKGSLRHCRGQLKKEPAEHVSDIAYVFDYAGKAGISVNVYLEDWSNGMIDSHDYVFYLIENIAKLKPKE